MNTLLFSIYYPHSKKSLIVAKCIKPLLKGVNYNKLNYFLSRYKGENVTIQLECDKVARTVEWIERCSGSFFKNHKAEQDDVGLPIRQLFLDFPFNTCHIWKHNPFRIGLQTKDGTAISEYQSVLSRRCLEILALEKDWDATASFQLFIELLFVIRAYLEVRRTVGPSQILARFQDELYKKLQDKGEVFKKYKKEGGEIFIKNGSAIVNYYRQIKMEIENSEKRENWVEAWLKILKIKLDGLKAHDYRGIRKAVRELILDTGQKIDLNPQGLVQALSVTLKLSEI
ncbi:MAG: hypothetical protein MI975_17760 [Cytophagales bacterium]|nr:hypothetical protein [Cytophagales bacterium]